MKKCICCCLSHQNPVTYLLRSVLSCKRCRFLSWFRPEHFFTGASVIMDYGLIFLDWLMFQLLSSPDVNWWTGVVWITCGLLWFFSNSHSDGTHSLHSIHCWDNDAETHFCKSDEETKSNTSQMAWGVSTFSADFQFWANYSHWACPHWISLE